MKRKSILILMILLCLTVLLTGCRTRTTEIPQPTDSASEGSNGLSDAEKAGNAQTDEAFNDVPGDGAEAQEQENNEPGAKTKENPDAPRKEYDEDAPAEVVPGTDRFLHSEGEGSGAPLIGEGTAQSVSRVNEQANETATRTIAAQEADQMGVDPDGSEADSSMTYFTVLLSDRMGSLFECQRLNAYWETAQDHVTVFKTSLEHSLILNAGAYDVSARLLEENLKVDDGWVVRKNPGLIVKIVDSSVLGSGVSTVNAAKAVYQNLLHREDWRSIDAVRNGRVVLLSEELLQAPYLQTAAMLIIAKTANSEVLPDVDLDEALQMLMEEASGTLPVGVYYYHGGAQ